MSLENGAWVYILRCADNSYYTGLTRRSLEERRSEHMAGDIPGWTQSRRPVELVFAENFQRLTDAIAVERQLKGWNRAKKKALIAGQYDLLPELASRRKKGVESD